MSSRPDLRDAYSVEVESHLGLVSDQTRAVLQQLIRDDDFLGSTDPPALGVLLAIVRGVQPRLMLELGTHVGFSALCIADVLEHNNYIKGELFTVDPNGQAVAAEFAARARLMQRVHFVPGLSTDAAVGHQLRAVGPFQVAYLDSSHSYEGTLRELDLLFGKEGLLSDDGLLLAHDAGPEAAAFDPTGKGGVPRAIDEWMKARACAYDLLVLGPPLWPCACGLGLVRRR